MLVLPVQRLQAAPRRSVIDSTTALLTPPVSSVDLSTYIRVGRFDLPEPTRTIPPANSLLAQEASAVTYNWDTDLSVSLVNSPHIHSSEICFIVKNDITLAL